MNESQQVVELIIIKHLNGSKSALALSEVS